MMQVTERLPGISCFTDLCGVKICLTGAAQEQLKMVDVKIQA